MPFFVLKLDQYIAAYNSTQRHNFRPVRYIVDKVFLIGNIEVSIDKQDFQDLLFQSSSRAT